MIKLARLFGFRRDTFQWENPRSSLGERRGPVQNGKYSCWEAVGPVFEAWNTLRPEIKDYVENSCKWGPPLSMEIYMIGKTEDTAAPKILICSTDIMARKEVRKAIMESGIMNNNPGIGLGDTAKFPDLVAQEDIERAFAPDSDLGDEIVVLSPPWDNAFGRRLFIPRQDVSLLRPATAGPLVYCNDQIYQLTVGHAFLELDYVAPCEVRSSSLDDCDFDGQSDSEDDDSNGDIKVTDNGNPKSKDVPIHNNCDSTSNEIGAKCQGSSSPETMLTMASPTLLSSTADLSARRVLASSNKPQKKEPAIPRKLDQVGKLALISEKGTKQSLDYALIELKGMYRHGRNEVACGPNGTQRWLRIRQAVEISSTYVNIITMTASSGFLSGKLCATASYMRLPNQRTLQELYSVRLKGKLTDGDCGSGVIDQLTGYLYGHIVAGSVGTGIAYIVPAVQVFEDISHRLGGKVTLVPPEKPTRSARFLKDRTGLEPLRVVEFASKEYFSQFKQPNQINDDKNNDKKAAPATRILAASSFLNIGRQMPHTQSERTVGSVLSSPQQKNSLRWPRSLHQISSFQSKVSTLQSKTPSFDVVVKGKGKAGDNSGCWKSLSFERRFFALPSDLQVQIIALLRVPDILNLRMASRDWHGLISQNETPISRAFLEYNRVPPFAVCLYPMPNPSEINLHYICGLWHRIFVASKLSAVMTEWITKDIFLRKAEVKRLEFLPQQARMHRRLVPLLFTIFHFLETCRYLRLKHLLNHGHDLLRDNSTINPVELKIMKTYDNETLLQVHQVFPLLVSCLRRKLRLPSYLGLLERSLRGPFKDPPLDHVHVAIFCIGGLRAVASFSEIELYDARRVAVDNWYASISHKPIDSGLQTHRWRMGLGWKQSRQPPLNAAKSSNDNTASTSASISSLEISGGGHDDWTRSSFSGNAVFNTSLAVGPPMAPLSAEHTRLLLPALPKLEQIWLPTAEALILARRAVERRQDIKKDGQVVGELIREEITDADEYFYGEATNEVGNWPIHHA